ncbi:TIGR04086 family membrane protein [Paenibacillus sp. CAA11]|uniref:TIGR04086 family membrane protein n=1 Tax=Paenibacillus sp. CAA11 TaxID=1532905 RepID=UPI000D37C0EE|nr:TIGR04086 family membrane protein [Paenibacillus sp. CAA11]AWB45699.1 TIGR04086 family membrane protein [Paenibacillus sp. CAA11]
MQRISKTFSFRIHGPTLSGLWYAYLWMMIGALALSLLLRFGHFEEEELSGYSYFVHGAAILLGSIISGRRTKRKGWYQGGLTGLFYGILLFVISFLALDSAFSPLELLLIGPAMLIGTVGGIFGKNMSRS